MLMRLIHISRWTTLALCNVILATLLIACGAGGGSASTSASISKPLPTPTSIRIRAVTLTGDGFTMSYPRSWHITRSGNHLVTVANSTNTMKLTITVVPAPNGTVTVNSLANSGLKTAVIALNKAQTVPVPPTTTVGGETWNQASVSGTQKLNNQNTMVQVVVLATVHPAKAPTSRGYTIDYRTTQLMFNQANTTYFQPMLKSFKFV